MSVNGSISKRLVAQKCKLILADVERISRLIEYAPYETFVTDEAATTRCERYFERIVNRALDINFHLIRAAGESPPEDYTRSFMLLSSLNILPAKLAADIAPSVGARNVLVHEYDDLDTKLFYSSLKDTLRLYPAYVKAIQTFVEAER